MIKKIIFDFDNTLVSSWPSMMFCLNKTLEHFNMEKWSKEKIKQEIKYSGRDYFPKIFGDNAEQAKEIYSQTYFNNSVVPMPLDGAEDLLSFLNNASIPCYIISNKRGDRLRYDIERLKWKDFFIKVVGSEDFIYDKPDAGIVEFTLEEKSSKEVFFIGDSDVDFLCAKRTNCTSFGVFPDNNICYNHSPDVWCDDLHHLKKELHKCL